MDNCAVLQVTEPPVFIDAGAYLRCELVSGGKKKAYRIEWPDALVAMEACGGTVQEHFAKLNKRGRNVRRLPKRGPPVAHG